MLLGLIRFSGRNRLLELLDSSKHGGALISNSITHSLAGIAINDHRSK